MKHIKDSRYNVWICEAKMSDGNWYPEPEWGASNKRRETISKAIRYFEDNGMKWAFRMIDLNKSLCKIVHSRRIRFRNYGGYRT